MIVITKEALFDLFQNNKAEFRDEYRNYVISISDESVYDDEDYEKESHDPIKLQIKKSGVIDLLTNRVCVDGAFSIRVEQ